VGDTRAEYDRLYDLYAPIGIAVGVLVGGFVLLAAYRGWRRSRPGATDEAPRTEIVLALIVLAVAGVLLGFTVQGDEAIHREDPSPGLTVDVTAYEWGWTFAYPASGVVVDSARGGTPVLGVPTGTTVRIRLRTRDVIHAFFVPELRFKHDAFPGHTAQFDLRWDRPGTSDGHCAEFCGLRHDRMTFEVRAMEPAGFRAWLASRRGAA
jgi:cytochrome c oxidase subunit 2